jgi:hypothetical protein
MTNKMTLNDFLETSINESNYLPLLPTLDELKLIRKGLRKKKVPDIFLLPTEFEYEDIGKFEKKSIGSDFSFSWKIINKNMKICSFSDLCLDATQELNRLEFGWMIANFAKLDGISYLSKMRPISYEDYHQNQFNKQYAKQQKHFEKIEAEWRHWAIVPAGHMLFT